MSSGKPSAGNETERESEPAASSRRAKASGVETKVLTRPEEFKVDLILIPGEPTKGIVTKGTEPLSVVAEDLDDEGLSISYENANVSFDAEYAADFPVGSRVAFGAVYDKTKKLWMWSGEGVVASHNLPLKWMKFAVSSADAALTTSHILLKDIKEAAKVDHPNIPAQKKLKKGILVCSETGQCLSNFPHSLETVLTNMSTNSTWKSIAMFVDIQSVVSFKTIRTSITKTPKRLA